MSMTTHNLIQGSPEWHAYRAQHFNASDAPAMMGCSPYMTRTELLAQMKTGITADVDAATQRRFDDGHRFEALARPLAEKIIGEDLYPVTGSRGKLSASFDGLTVMEDVAFEHKTLSGGLRDVMHADIKGFELPLQYKVQMEQQCLVSGAERVLFMASKWNGDELAEERHCWYLPDQALRTQIVAGWEQFERDLADFVPTAAEVKPTGKAPEALPALHIVINGGVSASNLDEFKETALGAIRSVNRELTTDVHFADAEKAVRWCSDIEDRIKAAKDHALSQTASIDELFRTMDEISAEARRVRLDLDKLVKARKDAIKGEIVAEGVAALAKYIRELNAGMPADYMPTVPADFGGCIRNLRTVESLRNAVNTELARAKVAASEIANLIRANLGKLDAANAPMLFADIKTLVLKQPDDLAAVIAQRLAAEAQRKEAERERIRAEEAARLEREAEAARKVREAAEEMARNREQEEASRLVDSKKAAIDPLPFIPVAKPMSDREWAALPAGDRELPVHVVFGTDTHGPAHLAPKPAPGLEFDSRGVLVPIEDDGARLTLGELNARLAPISIGEAGLSELGFESVQKVKNSRLYRACDVPAICRAISAHVLKAAQVTEVA